MKKHIGKQVGKHFGLSRSVNSKVFFDGIEVLDPPPYHWALAAGAKGDWWIHFHLGADWPSPLWNANGLLFRLLLDDEGRIQGLADLWLSRLWKGTS